MAIQVVRLGTAKKRDEGLRLGTVRLLPRGVKEKYCENPWRCHRSLLGELLREQGGKVNLRSAS